METWKEIDGYSRYMISNLGKIWSKTRVVKSNGSQSKTIRKGKFLKTRINDNGYETVNLCPDNSTRIKTKKVHRLIAQAFIPNPNNLPCINHKNRQRSDNRIENLEWCTSSDNNYHRWTNIESIKHREKARDVCRINGKRNRFISLETKLEIIKEYKETNILQKDLAKKYGISKQVICHIVNNKYFSKDDIKKLKTMDL